MGYNGYCIGIDKLKHQ